MWIRVEGGGSGNMDKDFFVMYSLFKDSLGIFKAYLVVFGLFLVKTEDFFKIPIVNHFQKYSKIIKFY